MSGLARPVVLVVAALVSVPASVAGAAAAAPPASAAPATVPTSALTWVDEPVSFRAGSLTVYGTFRHPLGAKVPVPAALLIAGSGPTDRNGNSALEPGPVGTLQTLADWLSSDGVASLRYDKLGSGQTGLGPFALDPASIGIAPFEQESRSALRFLAAQKDIDRRRLGVVGHSEGALFALLLATGRAGPAPPVRALALLEPLSERYLTVLSTQIEAQVGSQEQAGEITPALAGDVDRTLAGAVAQLRRDGTVPAGLPDELANVLNSSTALFLSQADHDDPAAVAAALPARTPVLVSCSDADVQVSCAEVSHLLTGLHAADARVDMVHLTDVDHVLKVDPSGSAADYSEPLPFSPQLETALAQFVQRTLQP